MTRTARTLSVAAGIVAVLFLLMLVIPVPYVILGPTTPTNTLGADPGSSGPVCDVTNPVNKTPTGDLALTTVGINKDRPSMIQAFTTWLFNDHDAVIPRSVLYPPGQSQQQSDQADRQQMTDSRAAAVQAAEAELELNDIIVAGFTKDSKASTVLKVGDRVRAINGTTLIDIDALRTALEKVTPGATVSLLVQRGTTMTTVPVVTTSTVDNGKTRTLLGFTVPQKVQPLNVQASFHLAGVSGPSAGMMFALCILDKLTPDNLASGLQVAGTGEISNSGDVMPIGGIQQKLYGAKSHGYKYFFVPTDNCSEAKGAHISGMQLIRVPRSAKTADGGVLTSLHVVRGDLLALKAGKTDLPGC